MITTDQVKQLRDATGVSVMQCRKALEEAEGDMEKAVMILKKKSSDIAAKKADREANDGIIVIKEADGKAFVLVLNCETDFVAQNDDFKKLAADIIDAAMKDGVEKAVENSAEMINPVIQKIGENIRLGKIEEVSGGTLGSYVHNGKAGVVVVLEGGTSELARDVAMHVAAMKPEYATREEVPAEMIEKARELFQKEVDATDKPEEIKKKMLEGKVETYFREQTLLDQPFVKNPDETVSKLLSNAGAKIVRFVRYTF